MFSEGIGVEIASTVLGIGVLLILFTVGTLFTGTVFGWVPPLSEIAYHRISVADAWAVFYSACFLAWIHGH